MNRKTHAMTRLTLCTALLALVLPWQARASEHRLTAPPPAVYAQECGACHAAYPAGLLPQASWSRILRGLEQHYGTDAALPPAAFKPIEAWLMAYGGSSKRGREEPPQDRITRAAWFERKHRQIDAAVWKLPSVKSPANCQACHAGAERGDFSDDRLTLPAGLSAWQRRAWWH